MKEGFDIWAGATFSVELLKFNLEFTQNSKYVRKSLTEPFFGGSGESVFFTKDEVKYVDDRAVKYEDKWAQIDLQRVLGWVLGWTDSSNTPSLVSSFLGTRKLWWGDSMLGKPLTFQPSKFTI